MFKSGVVKSPNCNLLLSPSLTLLVKVEIPVANIFPSGLSVIPEPTFKSLFNRTLPVTSILPVVFEIKKFELSCLI